MAENHKLRYEIDLSSAPERRVPEGAAMRKLQAADRNDLAQLMLDAYVGTIDYEGETLAEAIAEVDSWFAGSPLVDHSWGAWEGDGLRSATLVMEVQSEPFIAIVMTHPEVKRTGYGASVVQASIGSLRNAGHSRVVFYITEGNTASEALFAYFGAMRVPEQ